MSKKIEAFKFMSAQFVDGFLSKGTVKLGAAAEFRVIEGNAGGRGDENELRQIWDMEGRHELQNDDPFLRDVWGIPPAEANMKGLIIEGAKGAVTNLDFDALIYCASTELNDELRTQMASEFNADACVKISDFAEFARLIAMHDQIKPNALWAAADLVKYVDSKQVKRYVGLNPFEKEHAFGWQKEIRAIWNIKPAAKTGLIVQVPGLTPLLTRVY